MMQKHTPLAIAILAVVTCFASCGAPKKTEPTAPPLRLIEALVREQAERYPMMEAEDLYKVVYQATRGPRYLHMGSNSSMEAGLSEEMAKMKPSPIEDEPLVEVLDPDWNLVRINLRPWLKSGGTMEDLARGLGWTTLKYRGDRAVLVSSLAAASEIVDDLPLAFDRKDFDSVVSSMKAKEYPTGGHSATYADAYEPAYRLVLLNHLTDPDFGGRDGVIAWPERLPGSP